MTTKKKTKTLKRSQAVKQIDMIAKPLAVYTLLLTVLRYVPEFLINLEIMTDGFTGLGIDTDSLIASVILIPLSAFALFGSSAKKLHLNIQDYLKNKELEPVKTILLICTGLAVLLLTTSIRTLIAIFVPSLNASLTRIGSLASAGDIVWNVLYCLLTVLICPLCEEYIFRGIIQRHFGHYGRYFGVFASAFLYALTQGALIDMVIGFLMAWFYSLIALKNHSIIQSSVCHVIISFVNWFILAFGGGTILITALIVTGVFVAAILAFLNQSLRYDLIYRKEANTAKLWKIMLTTPAVIITVILGIANAVLAAVV